MARVSIIIPIYNAEEHLAKCVDSVLGQTEKDIEIILVDDGSKDNSLEICNDYAKQDKRIRVIHQENAGVSAARNKGILLARGEYIGFVDSDDWIDFEMYKSMLNEAHKTDADVVMCDARTVYDDGKTQVDTITQLPGNRILKKSDFTPSLLLEMAGSACRCIYKNNRYNDKRQKHNALLFPLGVKFSEDRIFNLYAFGQANVVSYVKEAYYNRYMNKKSAVHRFHKDYFEACKKAAIGIELAIQCAWNNNEELKKAYLGQFIGGAIGAVCNYYYKTSPLTAVEKKYMVKRVCEDEKLRTAIANYGADRRSRWILDKKYNLLIAYARLANWKHGR
ncbi:MAG: glycosyltransferase [Peptoniphilus sp.]|nr:glycosyltransferase [Peptoniphilus sp.]